MSNILYTDLFVPTYRGKSGLSPEEERRVQKKASVYGAIFYMAVIVVGFLLCSLFGSCRTKQVPTVVQLHDSTTTVTNTRIVYVPDTIPVQLPPELVEVTTPDTVSVLRTTYAESTAAIRSGMLYHQLRQLDTPVPVPVQHKETTRDSTITAYRDVPVPYPVIKEVEKPLSWWQQARLHLANIILVALALWALIWLVRRKIQKCSKVL